MTLIPRPAQLPTLASTALGTLELDSQGHVVGVKDVPYGTAVDQLIAAITSTDP